MDEKYKLWQYLIPYDVSKTFMGLTRTIHNGKFSLKHIKKNIKTGSEPQSVYLLDRDRQKEYMLQQGYTIDDSDDYGLVKKAVGDRKLPIYRTPGLHSNGSDMYVIGNINATNNTNWLGESGAIQHGGSYPTSIYYNDKDHYFYQRGWDLNDYGEDNNKQRKGTYFRYNDVEKTLANILDFVGNPMVISTGYRKTPLNYNNITLYEYSNRLNDYVNITDDEGIDKVRELFDTWLKKHKGSSIIDPYSVGDENTYDANIDHDYNYDKKGNIIYDKNGKPTLDEFSIKSKPKRYTIVNTTKVPEVVAKRKRRLLGGTY